VERAEKIGFSRIGDLEGLKDIFNYSNFKLDNYIKISLKTQFYFIFEPFSLTLKNYILKFFDTKPIT
jgi:hypothetical protein